MAIEHGTWLLVPSLVYALFWLLHYCDGIVVDPREPPLVRSRIPFFGHLISLLRHGTNYYVQLHTQTTLPIYTLGLLAQKVYVVNSLPLISAVHRKSKTLSFHPFVKLAAERLSGLDAEKLKAFDNDPEQKAENLSTSTLKGIARALSPGPAVADLNLRMLSSLQTLMNEPEDTPEPRCLLSFIQHVITRASTDAIYGPANPFVDPKTEEAFWTFENNAAPMLLGMGPRLIARKATQARDFLAHRILHYYETDGHKQGSSLARARMAAPLSHGLTLHDVAKLEVPFLIAILANTVPTTFWLLIHIYSRPTLLSSLRLELTPTVTTTPTTPPTHTLSLSLLQTACPLLLSTYHEILRLYSVFPLLRLVTAPTLLPGTPPILLQKDAYVMLPSNVIHTNPSIYSPDPQTLHPSRFQPKSPHPPASAFRAFGGAPNLCPGRHFATAEILATVATALLRYEIVPEGGVAWEVPEQDFSVFAAVPPPKRDVRVRFMVREEGRGLWRVGAGDEGGRWGLACG